MPSRRYGAGDCCSTTLHASQGRCDEMSLMMEAPPGRICFIRQCKTARFHGMSDALTTLTAMPARRHEGKMPRRSSAACTAGVTARITPFSGSDETRARAMPVTCRRDYSRRGNRRRASAPPVDGEFWSCQTIEGRRPRPHDFARCDEEEQSISSKKGRL